MYSLKWELEDLSFKYLHPEEYHEVVEGIDKKRNERLKFIEKIMETIQKELKKQRIDAEVTGRAKHMYSIYRKMVRDNKTLDQIYDLFALRILVKSVKDCYAALGIVHELYGPMPGRFKDYIAVPKPNMYQSIHTTLIGEKGTPFEVQIRTHEMHRIAEFGIAAHWAYKERGYFGRKENVVVKDDKLSWLRETLEWQNEMQDPEEFLATLKTELFQDEVYVFTPKGAIKVLPRGSTPIDFAYMIHAEIGHKMTGCKVNSKMVPIITKLENGDIVEIITSDNSKGPSRDWLKVVKSTQARTKINQWFRKQFKEEDMVKGKELLEIAAKQRGYNLSYLTDTAVTEIIYRRYGMKSWDAIYAAIGYGSMKERQIIQKLIDETLKVKKELVKPEQIIQTHTEVVNTTENRNKKHSSGIIVKGVGDIAVRFSKCCGPLPGDEIIGYITRGRGVSIHRADCVNVLSMPPEEKERLIEASWLEEKQTVTKRTYVTEIQITCIDRLGIIMDISKILTDMRLPVKSLNAKTSKGNAVFNVKIEIHDIYQLEELTRKLNIIKDVIEIIRVSS